MMMKHLIYFLVGICLLFYSLPYLTVTGTTAQTIFTVAWLFFALCSIGGNLHAFLHLPSKGTRPRKQMVKRYQKARSH